MRSQKGKIVSWIIFIILIVIVFGLLVFVQKWRKAHPAAPMVPPSAEEAEEKAKKPGKKFAAPELSEDEKGNLDNEALTIAMQNGEGCEEIKYNEELKQKCMDAMLYNSALQKNDEKLCGQIANIELKAECLDKVYYGLAIKNFDADLCKKITDADLKQNCLDRVQAAFGRTANSAKSCEEIEDEVLRQNCLDNFYLSDSIKNLDEESCENIQDAELKERCKKTVAKNIEVIEISKKQIVQEYKSNEEKLKDCNQLSGQNADNCKDEANYNLAFTKKDLSYCNAIQDSEKQSQCIHTQSANINNYYLRRAISRKDPSYCNKILDAGLRSQCLTFAQ